ncbi:hypothetical protein [Mangrovicoccus ximenensis]|uniref:hypothetical protein n=1 Tax=Mangrovicoccus ximenensis TaxID=1911570 RepID=UPI000D3B66F4|nr:hypothetical protein [Mangrovicoccus ximenensis]
MSLAFDPADLALPTAHFIGGEFVAGEAALDLAAPSDGRALPPIPKADAGLVDRAVETARAALKSSGWAGWQLSALAAQGVPALEADEAAMTVAGLAAAWKRLG